MNQMVTNLKIGKTIMLKKTCMLKPLLMMRAVLLTLCILIFAVTSQAQTRGASEIRMKTGTETITDELTYDFYDTGGPYILDPAQDPNNSYNWVTWYQHDESYLLHFVKPAGFDTKGIKVVFNYLLINNDHLKFYEGDLETPENLIADLTCNDYSTNNYAGFTVMSHGNMTIRFESDYHWRDAGWEALVELWDYAPQPPVANMQACASYVELLPGSMATGTNAVTTMYYTTDGTTPYPQDANDPLASTKVYNGPFEITQAGTTVKAILVESVGESVRTSSVSEYTFNRLITPPAAPTITHVANTNTVIITAPAVPSDINDTYYVRYSIDGTDPRYSTHERAKADTIELTQPCTVRAVTRGTTCPDIFSETEDTETISTIYVPTPVISITGTGDNGTVEITCSLTDAIIYYTIDGNNPTTSSIEYNGTFTVPAGTTVKAMAYMEGQGYVASNIATAIYIPGGQGGQGVFGDVVLLDDREPHTWSYYSDGDQPVHSLKPADVKITYFGNGVGTVTNASENGVTPTSFSLNATTVAVSGYEPANQFVYLKTLENADTEGTGNYPYTLIPNPFSKRPTVGTISTSAGATCWRGFYGWRVKRLAGVTITGYGVGDIIPAETEIEFVTTNATGNEVDFEAMWAQAWFATAVNNTNNLNADVTYERNFIRIAGAINTTNSRPATIMELYPNGTTNGSTAATAAPNSSRNLTGYSLSADTKFEFIALNRNSGTMTANNHYLCFGRGINASRNAANVRGMGGASTNALNYMLRLESGRYDEFAFIGNGNWTMSNRVLVKAILGCDYDRAKNDNAKLEVSRNSSMFYSTGGVDFSSSSNKDQKTFDCVAKSGTYQASVTNDGAYNHSLYCGHNSASHADNQKHYPGVRYVTVEGGNFASINGGRATDTWDDETTYSIDVVSFSARIKDGTIRGSVYGGAADNSAGGTREMIITGGEIRGWVAGGANGRDSGDQDRNARTNGNSRIYVGGNAIIGGANATTVNQSAGGQVFGAGRGTIGNNNTNLNGNGYPERASVINSYVVIADNATISNGNSEVAANVYGGGNYGYVIETSNVYILGGTVKGNVYGGAYGNYNPFEGSTNIFVKGGSVNGSVYGGSNEGGKIATSNVTMTGGIVNGSVFGAGLGIKYSHTTNPQFEYNNEVDRTNVIISGGTINNNVYGGGQEGRVNEDAVVTVSGGTMKNIFGAGMGSNNSTANIGGTTAVTVSGGTISESVYGGGENGNVKQANNPAKGDPESPRDIPAVSTVNIEGGSIAYNVFGGGKMGFTNGGTVVNMIGGTVEGSVFGGAFGTNGTVYVAGQRTVNMRGGTINKHLYGGSRNADDALTFNPGAFSSSTETATASVVNMSGGYVHYQVFASGYFGQVFGSTYAFIGTNAIMNAPYHVAGTAPYNEEYYNHHYALRIGGSVWAGGDFGNYDGTKFGDPTITGRSHIYIDGTGYDTESNNTTNTNYMNIGGSIYGSGTSCDAGIQGRYIILRNYGQMINASQPTAAMPYSSATRSLYSIQRADSLTIDNAHVVLLGEGKINSLVTTEKYTIHEFRLARLANGSSIFLNYPADQIMKFGSYTCPDVYDNLGSTTYTKVDYNGLGAQGGSSDNKIRVSNGAYINIYHDELKYTVNGQTQTGGYGELEGFAHMMSDDANNTCAYARPKQSTDDGNQIPENCDNPNDGGFISYDTSLNTYDLEGGTVTGGNSIQMPYENHTAQQRQGEQYFRIWRAGGTKSYREGVFVAQSRPKMIDGELSSEYYSTVDVVISLPAFENCESGTGYYRLKTLDGNTIIDQGTDVMLVNAACYADTTNHGAGVDGANWMYIDGDDAQANFVTGQTQAQLNALPTELNSLHYIAENPDVNFGLIAIPSGGLAGNDNMLICEASDPKIATMQWTNMNNSVMPKVTFRLTYYNNLTNNVVWDPMTITFEQVDCSGNVAATIDVALTVTTLTSIDQTFVTQAYGIVRGTGTGTDSYTAKIVLPQYVMHVNTIGEISKWSCESVSWDPLVEAYEDSFVGGTNYLNENLQSGCNNKFGMNLVAGLNFDNTTGWESWETVPQDVYNWNKPNYVFGETTARTPIGFDFTLLYDGRQRAEGNYQLGTLTFHMKFTNYEGAGVEPYSGYLTIQIEVWFLGQGNNYYLDGVNGNNLYSGKYPNAAKKTLSGIFNRTDYVAGDNIFVVNAVTADGSSKLTWNGKTYSEVTLYRYPGGHQCVPDGVEHAESHWSGYDIEGNPCYQGPLVKVEKTMDMTGIILNGFYKESKKPEGEAAGDLFDQVGDTAYYHKYVDPTAPLVQILDGGTLSVYGASRMEYNNNVGTDGGGIYIENGGVLNLYDGSAIDTNYVSNSKNGGGIYVNSTSLVQLSDEVYVTGNRKGVPSAKADESIENNVYLSTYDSHVNVGTSDTDDAYTLLLSTSRVGITKTHDWGEYYYAPVAYSDGGLGYLDNLVTEDAPATGAIMWDDETKYEILSLNNTHLNPPTDYVYFVGTWVTAVTSEPDDFDANDIDTPEELAWAISISSGYNGETAAPDSTFTLTGDIDMNANIWVPIGSNGHPYTGNFNGNGHVVTGLRSPLNQENMGMFGSTNGATITDLVAQANFVGGTMKNVGTVIGKMNGGVLSNVEAAGTLTGTNSTVNIGGLVGDAESGTIHSGFAVNTMTGGNNTVVGGLVGTNGANLYNSYANVTLGSSNTATTLGGLVGINKNNCTVENCYVINPIGPAFAYTNNGNINFCYAANGTTDFVGAGSQDPVGHGTYDVVLDRKDLGYMYFDNKVEKKVETDNNGYITQKDTIYYAGGKIEKWRGLLSTLNQWVDSMNMAGSPLSSLVNENGSFTGWFRPTSDTINGDLPVLGFPKDNAMGTLSSDGKFLRYGSNVNGNGVDELLAYYDDNNEGDAEPKANIFHYGKATEVAEVPTSNVYVFINEDAVLKQAEGAGEFGNTTVGITFDNSCRNARDYYGNLLEYDWHYMSSSLSNAPMGATYGSATGYGGAVSITKLENNYFPNSGLTMGAGYEDGVKWDLYSYYEPEYHWINLKRGGDDHWHRDGSHEQIDYVSGQEGLDALQNETIFVPGKGYMMAISQDSYLSSTGTLNNGSSEAGGVQITLTNQEPLDPTYNKGWNLVGNPYQAYLDLTKVGTGTYYIYDADQNVYAPVTNGQSENPCIPSLYIHPHQGFFMYSSTDNNTITFDYADGATTSSETGSYFRGNEEKVNYPLVNLFAENQRGNRDLTVIELHRPELGGATKVMSMLNSNFQIAASLDGQNYGILFTPEGTERVPVRFKTEENGTFTLRWSTHNGDFTSLRLIDNITGVNYDMLANDHYTFEASTEDYASRFYITYTCTGVDEEVTYDSDNFAFFDGSEWVVNGKGQLDVVDMTGRVLFTEQLNNDQNRVNLNGFAQGVYLMRVIDNKVVRTQKIIVR